MVPSRDNRFAYNVRQIRSNCIIPINSQQTQRRTGNETPANAKEAAQDPNKKPDDDQIERVDV
jgi:hypothetical protein